MGRRTMKEESKENAGMRRLLKKYRNMFQIPENLNHYSEADYKIAERKFLKYALAELPVEAQREL
jgi:hypothetical protein